ncbi:MAG TPA: PAS domain S-box protein [Terriglobales bacterium]|nr:PAS domain S-box protein [Terriglobales bacterium]
MYDYSNARTVYGTGIRRYRISVWLFFSLSVLAPLAVARSLASSERQQVEVLFLSLSDPDGPDTAALIEEVESQIIQGLTAPVHFALEYIDPLWLGAEPSRKKNALSFLREKRQGQLFDLVVEIGAQTVAADDPAASLFPDTPLLFYVVNPVVDTTLVAPTPGRTGVIRSLNYLPTLQLALRQNPGTRDVVVIAGSSDFEKLEMNIARDEFRPYEPNVTFQYWTDLRLTDLKSRLMTVPHDTVTLFLDFGVDSEGEQFVPSRILRIICPPASRPIYGTFASFIGRGVVGGSVVDLRQVGRILGKDAARILNGEKADAIPVETGDFQRNMFDWRQLHRWGIANDELPPGSSVLYWEHSPWELYRWRILALSTVLGVETLLIFLLLHNRATRQRAEDALRRKEAELSEAQRLAQIGSWQWDPQTDAFTWSEVLFCLTGFDSTLPMPSRKQLSEFFTAGSWAHLNDSMDKALRTGHPYDLELEALRRDGRPIWVAIRGEPVRNRRGDVIRLRGTMQDITRQKQAAAELKKSEEMFSKAFRQGPMALTLTSAKTQRFIDVNETFERVTGYRREELTGRTPIEVGIWADSPETSDLGKRLLAGETLRDVEFRFITKSGQTRVVHTSAELIDIAGEPCVLAAAIDVTDRTRTEQALLESERRFRLMSDSAPVLMWMAGPDKLCTDFNKEWLRFTGRTMQQELGEGWAESIHPNDSEVCLRTYTKAFDMRREFSMEYRLRRHDGQYRWILDKGVPRFLEDGTFAGYIGYCVDITEQKEAKVVRAELSGRLMRAHEEERTRIARELHDDINQRLALLANGIQQLEQTTALREARHEKAQLHAFWQLTSEIATDLQHLSHELHPSKLHYLGLPAALRGLCHEFSQLHNIEVDCIVRDLPADLDEDVSLSLFRTAQESLHNVAKHSHAHLVKVELICEENKLILRVSDDGAGFDFERTTNRQGLGLISMQERLKSVGGQLSVWSHPSLGTQVEASVPAIACAPAVHNTAHQ